jgi:hypothetical protein
VHTSLSSGGGRELYTPKGKELGGFTDTSLPLNTGR